MNFYAPRKNKYNSRKTVVDGITFDSKKEAVRWAELKLMERAGFVSDLKRQVRFQICPKTGKERARHYIADFTYTERGKKVIEDVKSPATRKDKVYSLKRALVRWQYPDWDFREY